MAKLEVTSAALARLVGNQPCYILPDEQSLQHLLRIGIDLRAIATRIWGCTVAQEVVTAQRIADAMGAGAEKVAEANASRIARLVDGVLASPPAWEGPPLGWPPRVPWPPPHWNQGNDTDALSGRDLVELGAHLVYAADAQPSQALRTALRAAAERLFIEGLTRLDSIVRTANGA